MKNSVKLSLSIIFILLLSMTWSVFVAAQEEQDEQWLLGAQVYAENCAVCHGTDGEGRVGATLSKDWPSIRPDLLTKDTIEKGVPGSLMPAWGQTNGGPLSDEEIEAVVYYILSWQTGGAPEITPVLTSTSRPPVSPVPGVEGDPNQGGVLYDQNCAVCHGENGEGRIGATLAQAWPSIRPDLTIKSTIERGVDGSVMPAWSQVNGGPLKESEIENLVAFLLSWDADEAAEGAEQPTSTPETESPFSGLAGVVFAVVAFVLLIGVFLLGQRISELRQE